MRAVVGLIFLIMASEVTLAQVSYIASAGCQANALNPYNMLANEEKYSIKSLLEEPVLVCDEELKLEATNWVDLAKKIAERYKDCLNVTFDDANKTVTIEAGERLTRVEATHRENSVFTVEDENLELATRNERTKAFYCPYKLKGDSNPMAIVLSGREIAPE